MKEKIEQQIQVMLEKAENMGDSEYKRGYMTALVNLWQQLMDTEAE